MAKVLLVEDDNNLREIYQARLTAEGYDIVTAQNGEEALVVAKQNKPDLIISDVMMPRISGFEMLDILRNTNELKHTRVIMLTALGQADDQKRATSLGADRYLVKSQVTLEDIVNAAKELLTEDGAVPAEQATAPATETPESAASNTTAPAAPGNPGVAHIPDSEAPAPVTPTLSATPMAVAPEPTADPQPVGQSEPAPTTPVAPATPTPTEPPTQATNPAPDTTPPAESNAATPAPESAEPAQTQPVSTTAAPAPEPIVAPAAPAATPVQPPATPLATPTEPDPTTVPEPAPDAPTEPAVAPAKEKVDAAAQGLEAEEAALQAQIASYSKDQPAADSASTSNDQALAEAVKELDQSTEPTHTPAPEPTPSAPPVTSATPPAPAPSNDNVQVAGKKVIHPISAPEAKPNLNELLAKEEAKDAMNPPTPSTGQPFDPNTAL